ncbi:MAG: DUF1579 family protein [Planctomycetes bacterium]|nr:DUF1579 family protein [Planctomycetota bacterium]
MRPLLWCSLVLLALALTAAGQIPAPPEALKKLDPMLGNWEGSGTVRMAPDGEAYPWTCRSTAKRVLDGHFVLEDLSITMGPGMPNLEFRTIYAWNRETERILSHSFSNGGMLRVSPLYFTADGKKLVDATAGMEEGQLVAGCWVSELGEGEVRFRNWRSAEGGEPYLFLEGTMKRGGRGFSLTADSATIQQSPPSEKLAVLAPMVGEWSFKGWMKPKPDAEKVKISGRETITRILGGHIYFCDVTGDESPDTADMPLYRGFSLFGWDPVEKCLKNVGFSNYGEFHAATGYPHGDGGLVMLSTALQQGVPTAIRSTLRYGKDEILIEADELSGDRPAVRTFEGKFTRRSD